MKTIEERANRYISDLVGIQCEEYEGFIAHVVKICGEGNTVVKKNWNDIDAWDAYVSGATEQKAIDDAEIVRLKAAWEQEAEINHDAEMAYKQGRHDAIDKACEWLEKHSEFWVYDDGFDCVKDMIDNFRKAMEE